MLKTMARMGVYLKDCMTSRGVCVSASLTRCSKIVAVSDELEDIFDAFNLSLGEADHDNLLLAVLKNPEL